MPKEKIIFGSRKDYISVLIDLFHGVKNKLKPLDGIVNPWFLIRIQTGYFFHLIYSGKLQVENEKTVLCPPKKTKTSFIQKLKNGVKQLLLALKINQQHKLLKNKLKDQTLYLGYQYHNIKEGKYNIYLHPFYEEETKKERFFILILSIIIRNYNPIYNFY